MGVIALVACSIVGVLNLHSGNKYAGGFCLFAAGMNLSSILGDI
ncbi:hypothetical protein NVP2095A_10 [Vibrio phage 2.095.A._10N.286.46.E10]|nr:hypothetical protein NVP2095A_10 [Vibrio phage 2.095.A._10N.286.46.E10]AUS02168.1 hypothetical protein NVP2095B_10 [Vibrio phage 2.095.B._10N.286.46.E10]